jgi:hypothetical protein
VGTRYEDQPAEHWAGAESLDPTPVWKQYVLVALLLLLSLVLVVVVSIFALLPQLVAPPAYVPGGRLVLAGADVPAPGEAPRRIGAPVLPEEQALWILQPAPGEIVAVAAWWRAGEADASCPVRVASLLPDPRFLSFRADCPAEVSTFDPRGAPITAARGLDRYLVARDGERVIVNVGRPIRGFGASPQPKVSPLVDR